MRVALFVTCLNDTLFPGVGQAVVRLLERLGHEVDFPLGQTCCGQMHVNSGYPREAAPIVRGFVEAFSSYDVVVAPSGRARPRCATSTPSWPTRCATPGCAGRSTRSPRACGS